MSNIVIATFAIEGTRPLLWHHFGADAIPLQKQEVQGVAGNNPEEWKKTVLMDSNRQLFLLNTYIFGCLRDAAPFIKRGRRLQIDVCSTLQVMDEVVRIDNRFVPKDPLYIPQGQALQPLPEVYIDVAGVKNPGSGNRNIRYRIAATAGWQCQFCLVWDKTVVSREVMETLSIEAGKFVGLGDGRRLGFGRFKLLSIQYTDTS
jgi:hypothetical protein